MEACCGDIIEPESLERGAPIAIRSKLDRILNLRPKDTSFAEFTD